MSPIVLRAGRTLAHIHPHDGGRIGQLDFGDGPVLRGPSEDLAWPHWGSYPMLPWSNRIPAGHLVFGNIDAKLGVNWPDGSAIHGLTASCEWRVVERSDRAARLEVDASAGPYVVRGEQSFAVSEGALDQTLRVVNLADHPVPVGLGIHPWFRPGRVRIPAAKWWPGHVLPTGEPPIPAEGEDDLRAGSVPPFMDRCYTDLTGTEAELPGVVLSWEGPITQIVVYTGEPGTIAVEPVTMASDGFGLAARGVAGHGVQELAPGEDLAVAYRFARPQGCEIDNVDVNSAP